MMKKATGSTSHRQAVSSSVGGGSSIKVRSAAANSETATNTERTGYHQGASNGTSGQSSKQQTTTNPFKQSLTANSSALSSSASAAACSSGGPQERKCDSCKYRTPINQCTTFRCRDCGTYIVSPSRQSLTFVSSPVLLLSSIHARTCGRSFIRRRPLRFVCREKALLDWSALGSTRYLVPHRDKERLLSSLEGVYLSV